MAPEQHRLIPNTQSVSTTLSTFFSLNIVFEVIREGFERIAAPTIDVIPTTIAPSIGMRINVRIARDVRTHLAEIIDELEALKQRAETLPDSSFRPTNRALRYARFYIFETYGKMGSAFPPPSFVLDGEEGVILKWAKNGHSVRLNCLSGKTGQDYIYFENSEYDIEDDVTPDKIKDRLNWLNQHEREPAR